MSATEQDGDANTLISPLIYEIRQLGLRTESYGLQGDCVQMLFCSPTDLLRFMKIIWDGKTCIHDTWILGLAPKAESCQVINIIGFTSSLRFPQCDLPMVMNCIELHKAKLDVSDTPVSIYEGWP
jgi:hypothetical protein